MKVLYTGNSPELESMERGTALKERIAAEISARGAITFARFMEMALYEPQLGYYRSGRPVMSCGGDFLTAPETHPAFGELLAIDALAHAGEVREGEFTVVEQGSGSGALARSFARRWSQETRRALHYVMVDFETGELPAPSGVRFSRAHSLDEVAPFEGVFLSNELPDAFPVHRVRRHGESLVEVMVGLEDGELVEAEGPPSTGRLAGYLAEAGIALADGAEIEVNLRLEPWLRKVSELQRRGRVITIDYGFEACHIGRFPRGTLLAHYRHTTNEEFLARPGRQDLTAHVCWTALEAIAQRLGFRVCERMTQREFLTKCGWKEMGRRLLGKPFVTSTELEAFDRLGSPSDGMGGNGVLVLEK